MYGFIQGEDPAVTCGAYGSAADDLQESCQDILDTMPANAYRTIFGPGNEFLARVHTPFSLPSRKSGLHAFEEKLTKGCA